MDAKPKLQLLTMVAAVLACQPVAAQNAGGGAFNDSYGSLFIRSQVNPLPDDEMWKSSRRSPGTSGWAGSASPWGIAGEKGANTASPWGIARERGANTASPWGIARERGANTASPWGIAGEKGANTASPWGIAGEKGANTASPWGIAAEKGANTASPWGIAREPGMNSYRNRPNQIRMVPVLYGNYRNGRVGWLYQAPPPDPEQQ